VQDPELSYTPKGAAVCKFTVASNRFSKQEEELQKEVSSFHVTTRTRLAEVCGSKVGTDDISSIIVVP
jgi:single-strand DNA-binding protein